MLAVDCEDAQRMHLEVLKVGGGRDVSGRGMPKHIENTVDIEKIQYA